MSNEVLNVIKKRRSIRTYKADAIPEEILNAVLEAGTFAPTGGGKQSPIIVAITLPQENMMLAAASLGLGLVWVHSSYIKTKKVLTNRINMFIICIN